MKSSELIPSEADLFHFNLNQVFLFGYRAEKNLLKTILNLFLLFTSVADCLRSTLHISQATQPS